MAKHTSKCCSRKERRELIDFLLKNDYEYKRDTGSHSIYKNRRTGDVQVVTIDLNKMICKRIMKEVLCQA